MKEPVIEESARCCYCKSPFTPTQIEPWPGVKAHTSCEAGARQNDRSLRARYIEMGLIRPGRS